MILKGWKNYSEHIIKLVRLIKCGIITWGLIYMSKYRLNNELIEKIAEYRSDGATIETIAALLEIPLRTLKHYLDRGELVEQTLEEDPNRKPTETEKLYLKLLHAFKRAEAEWEVGHLRNINKHAANDWHASAWALERRFPDKYSKREQMMVSSDNTKIVFEMVGDEDDTNTRKESKG